MLYILQNKVSDQNMFVTMWGRASCTKCISNHLFPEWKSEPLSPEPLWSENIQDIDSDFLEFLNLVVVHIACNKGQNYLPQYLRFFTTAVETFSTTDGSCGH